MKEFLACLKHFVNQKIRLKKDHTRDITNISHSRHEKHITLKAKNIYHNRDTKYIWHSRHKKYRIRDSKKLSVPKLLALGFLA